MSTAIMAACWPLTMSAPQKAVLISLADNANDAGICWPSIDTISKRTCLHRASVIRAIEALEHSGHLVADRSNGRHTHYIVTPNLGLFDEQNQSQAATIPVAQSNRLHSATGRTEQLYQSQAATIPVAQCDTNRKQPSITVMGRARKRATPIPADFTLTPERLLEARKRRVGDPELEFEKFRAHHEAHGKTMRDWEAAWRTWCMNCEKFGGTAPRQRLDATRFGEGAL